MLFTKSKRLCCVRQFDEMEEKLRVSFCSNCEEKKHVQVTGLILQIQTVEVCVHTCVAQVPNYPKSEILETTAECLCLQTFYTADHNLFTFPFVQVFSGNPNVSRFAGIYKFVFILWKQLVFFISSNNRINKYQSK